MSSKSEMVYVVIIYHFEHNFQFGIHNETNEHMQQLQYTANK